MKTLHSIAALALSVVVSFIAGWSVSELRVRARLDRLQADRDLHAAIAEEAVRLGDRALEHSLTNADTLALCLGKLGLRPVPKGGEPAGADSSARGRLARRVLP